MKKKIIISITLLILFIAIGIFSFAKSEGIIINKETLTLINKKEKIASNFDSYFNITGSNSDGNSELKKEIKELTQKTTYLLLGEADKQNESSENYYKRKHDYIDLRYNPNIPKDPNSYIGLDENSQEYKDDLVSGISVKGMFNMLNELDVTYSSFGDIRVTVVNDDMVVSSITLPNVTMKEQDEENPMKYNRIQTDLTMFYYFKKLNNEYKLLYIYGESNDDIKSYIEGSEEKAGELSKDKEYNTELVNIYDFSKANAITDNILEQLYEENKYGVVFLNSIYQTGIVTSANGFFIRDGIIITTYNYVEKSLMKAQTVIISDTEGEIYELDGIVTMDLENDIAILKVKQQNQNSIKIDNIKELEKEDGIITLNSKTGVGLTVSKGIITTVENNIQTSIPITEEMQGSPIFDAEGNFIGMINSKIINASISMAVNNKILKEYYDKLLSKDYNDIKAIPFNDLKENYYIKYNEEKIINTIPQNKWDEFSKAEDANDMISLKLMKGSYKNGIISLRYKNDISNYMDTMQFAQRYKQNLKSKGYKEVNISNSKAIYENDKYKIIIMKEFDYLIIIMVKL